ncbi:tRNA 2'-phosphotransferase 1 [Symbiodinium microadriaticum]|uniref:2'-phosphotransferase n=1 Tax=Symbiodinium microadriaticum TaxID=2951 RepID=A0A1Q9BXL3_SYMMI|nr:tRNA 2'-phosphotransferase 1 [Symbiodinium microadriaticum]CAE7279329.1 unnamed protein product [Symbiodinium sp. KB8]CAE7346778.1 unnamed protein product [Symbiodinium microadriaticum]
MGRAHYRPDGTRRRTSGELAGRAKKKAQREAQAQAAAAAAAPSGEAEQDAGANEVHLEEPACDEEELVEIEVEVAEEEEASPVRQRPRVHLRRLFALSKALTRLLRHKAEEEGLPLRPDGLFCLDAVVRTREMRQQRATSAELLQVTYQDEKQRFTIRRLDGVQYIRAAQGHSQYVSKEHLMQRVRRKDLPPYLYHGTRAWNYESIARRGLLAGGPSGRRTDIHLVEHLPNSGRKGGLRRAREARGGYMCAVFAALVWSPQFSEQVRMPTLDSPRPTASRPMEWTAGDDESEDAPPPPAPTAPSVSTAVQSASVTVGSPLTHHHLGTTKEFLERARSTHSVWSAPVVVGSPPTHHHLGTTALIEAPTNTAPAPQAPDKPPQMNWADNEAFQFNPESSLREDAGPGGAQMPRLFLPDLALPLPS